MSSTSLGVAICEALGIDPRLVVGLELEVSAAGTPQVIVRRAIMPSETAAVGAAIDHFAVVSNAELAHLRTLQARIDAAIEELDGWWETEEFVRALRGEV